MVPTWNKQMNVNTVGMDSKFCIGLLHAITSASCSSGSSRDIGMQITELQLKNPTYKLMD